MNAKEKSMFSVYRKYWDYGEKIIEYDRKIAFFIKNYSINRIFESFKKDSMILKESEKKEFELMIMQLKEEKKNLNEESSNCTVDEYKSLMSHIFSKVDEEDRSGEITINTSFSFKLVADLIDVLAVWGEIPEEWVKISKNQIIILFLEKYCKFKAVDLYKCIKQGILPKRGGPKEEEDNIVNELCGVEITERNSREDIKEDFNFCFDKTKTKFNIVEDDSTIQNKIRRDKLFLFGSPLREDETSIKDNNKFNILDRLDHNLLHNLNQAVHHTNCINNTMIKHELKMDPKIQKKIGYSLPVKFKSIDYFRLTDIIFKLLENGLREIQSDKVEKSLVQLELAVYYLHNVEN